jgi:tRNA threonylcarbamoyladenosine biosynthesis protein TsaB
MTLTLCLHSSSAKPSVFVFRDGQKFVPKIDNCIGDPTSGPSIAELAADALSAADAGADDVDQIAIDIGPGRLSAVRAAVAFTNAFSFGLGKPVLPIISSFAVGLLAERKFGLPAIVVHKSAGGTAFVGRVVNGSLETLRHGSVDETVRLVAKGLQSVSLVGAPASLLKDIEVTQMGDPEISGEIFPELIKVGEFVAAPVHPITEQSALINV